MRTPYALAFLGLALLSACLSACKKQESKSVVLAQVGKSTLTLDDLRESFPAEFEQLIRREQYLDFIKRWIDDEAVYQQAKQSKLESDPVVARKLEKMRRKLLIEEFLAHENAGEVFEPDDMAMNQYYEMHKEDFRRKVPEYKYAHIRAQTNKQASELRSKAQRSDFLAVAGANSLDPAPESYASIAFKKLSEVPPCLAQELEKAGIGGVSLPVACSDGFYLVKVLEKQDAGSLIAFPEAKEEISGILILERKDKLQEGRIAKYKEGLAVSYNLDNIPGLSDNGDVASGPAAQAAAAPAPVAAHASGPSPASNSRPVAAAAASRPVPAAASRPVAAPAVPKAPASPSVAVAPVAASPSPAHVAASPSAPTTNMGAQAPAAAAPAAPVNPALPREPWDPVPAAPPAKPKSTKKHARPAAPAATAPDSGAAVNATSQKTENADAPDTIPSH
ncbi:MAG: peptidyl-prolyl cis-trans isomerase [Fibrobacteres bacterium]|nr:peptidyl-prolyl cis-trans isomerase [Fibrobacterota bacterium]